MPTTFKTDMYQHRTEGSDKCPLAANSCVACTAQSTLTRDRDHKLQNAIAISVPSNSVKSKVCRSSGTKGAAMSYANCLLYIVLEFIAINYSKSM